MPALCNRIDRNTSGIVIAAKNAEALRILNQKIKDREIKKRYLLVCIGTLAQKKGTFKDYLLKDERKNTVSLFPNPVPSAKSAILNYRVLAEKNDQSLVEVELITGRTHQIRAQFAKRGNPLLGDGKYGLGYKNKEQGVKSQLLCAYKLTFGFTTDAGILSYLNNRTFELESVPFAEHF